MYRKFKHLNIPDGWEQYWSKYPNGYTIMEALIDWVSQVDDMVNNQNELTDTVKSFGERIDAFINQFGAELQKEVQDLLTEWQGSGFLDVVISEALQWQLDDYITTNEQDKVSITAQLQQTQSQLNDTYQYVSSYKTSTNTWTDAFESCVNYAISKQFKKIKLPKGILTIDRDLLFSGSLGVWDLIFEGEGKGVDGRGTSIKIGTNGSLEFDLRIPTAGAWRGLIFRDMTFSGEGQGLNNGIKLIFNQQTMFVNCGFSSFGKASIITGNSHYPYFTNCSFISCGVGIFVPDSTNSDFVSGDANNGKIDNCWFTYCDSPLTILGGNGWKVDNTDFEGGNGAIILGSNNKFENVRLERNKNNQKWMELRGNNNTIVVNTHMRGGEAAQPLMEINGDYNEVTPNGTSFNIVNETSKGINNIINLSNNKPLANEAIIKRWKKPNYLKFIIPSGTNLVTNKDLKTWTKTAGITVTDDNFSGGEASYLVTKTATGIQEISFSISGNFKARMPIYLTFKKQDMAGGGWLVAINDGSFDIGSNFDNLGSTITILAYLPPTDMTSIPIKIRNEAGVAGSAMKINKIIASDVLSGDFNI